MNIVLYDDERARRFEPFALTRPVSELRAGTEIVRRRWETALAGDAVAFLGAPHLADFEEIDAPLMATRDIAPGTIIAHSRFAPTLGSALLLLSAFWLQARSAIVRPLPEGLRDKLPVLDRTAVATQPAA